MSGNNDMNNNNTSPNVNDKLFGIELDDVPRTDSLQARILQETRGMQQNVTEESVENLDNITSLASFAKKKYFAPFALAASVALMAVLFMPINTVEQNIAAVDGIETLSGDDWSFEEAMLFEDELMFANL